MAESCHSSTSSLCEVEALRARLEEKEANLQTAAQYGLNLLNENKVLAQNLDDANKTYTKQIETLKEESYSISQKLEQKGRMELEYQEEIESLKKHVASQRDELKVLRDLGDQSAVLSDLRRRLREAEAASDKLECDNRQLQTVVRSYEEELAETNAKVKSLQDGMNETASDELSSLLSQLNEVTQAKDELVRTCKLHEREVHSLTEQMELQLNQVSGLREELATANSQISSLSNSFMAVTDENQQLRCEIDMHRMTDRDHKSKGNSMFTELDDKRQEAEKKLLLLNVKYDSLVNQYNLNKRQMSRLKIQMSSILRMASGQVGSDHVTDLENQLVEARHEIQDLTNKLSKLSATQSSELTMSAHASLFTGSDRTTLEFVENLLKAKDGELKALNKELEERRLAASYNNQQLNDVQHRLRSMESKVNTLQSQNLELSAKLEELKLKYDEGDSPRGQLVARRVEEIVDYNPEIARALLTASGEPTAADQPEEHPSHSDQSSENPSHNDQSSESQQSTCSTDHSLSEIQNTEVKETSPTRRRSQGPKVKSLEKSSLYRTKRVNSLASSAESLMGGKANAKSCDIAQQNRGHKVVNLKVDEQNPDNCPTQ